MEYTYNQKMAIVRLLLDIISVDGKIDARETFYFEKVKEELGLDFSKDKFIEYDSGCDGKDCYKMYFVTKDIDIKDIKIQEEELSEVRWFSMDELKHMVKIKELNEDQIACFNKVCNYLDKSR